jgi:hypothetical protein
MKKGWETQRRELQGRATTLGVEDGSRSEEGGALLPSCSDAYPPPCFDVVARCGGCSSLPSRTSNNSKRLGGGPPCRVLAWELARTTEFLRIVEHLCSRSRRYLKIQVLLLTCAG